jgi:UDP-N-acetyl-D-galactosamine dehydrogenase
MKIGIVGLGYVGLQLAVAFGQRSDTVGYDPNREKIEAYRSGIDRTHLELIKSELPLINFNTGVID